MNHAWSKGLLIVGWLASGTILAALALGQTAASKTEGRQYSGMYAFLKEGEFVQLTIEDGGRVSGFVSRYGDSDSDKGTFLNQFFKTAKLEGSQLAFTTDVKHGEWFEFKGMVERGDGKNPGDEAYYVLKGTLIETRTDENKKAISQTRDVALKEFPADASR